MLAFDCRLVGLVINLFAPVLIGAFGGGAEAVSYGVAGQGLLHGFISCWLFLIVWQEF